VGAAGARPIVLDAGALIAFERGLVRMRLLVETAFRQDRRLIVTTGVVAQVWRDGARQARVAALVHDRRLEVVPLSLDGAKAVGVLCGRNRASDVVDGHVALVAAGLDGIVVTSNLADISRFGDSIAIETI
jgi:ribosomal protein L18